MSLRPKAADPGNAEAADVSVTELTWFDVKTRPIPNVRKPVPGKLVVLAVTVNGPVVLPSHRATSANAPLG